MFRCLIRVPNVLMLCFLYVLFDDMLAAMFGTAALFRCMIGFPHVRCMLRFLLCVWLSFALWMDKYVCLGLKRPCCLLDTCYCVCESRI